MRLRGKVTAEPIREADTMTSQPVDPGGLLGLENYRLPDNFGRLIGYEVVAFDRQTREAEVRLTVGEMHLSSSGRGHGGMISALLDFACGVAVCTTLGPRDQTSTVELKVNYFRPTNRGDVLSAKARVVFRGRRLCALSALLHRGGEVDPVAMATATYNVLEAATEA
jgi:uncharacterized protein (TIGR00369 family)